jgi:chemotaxis protein MotB
MDEVLFDSGKAALRSNALTVLDRVAKVLQEVPMQPVQIEGHTDNEPIRYSGWADNDELSLARARAVAEYLTTNQQIARTRLTVMGYGEERPIASNDTPEGRQKNRRVEIVILPKGFSK